MPAGRIRTQGLTEGAILAALVAALAAAARYVPLLGIVTTYLCPLPLAVLVIRHGFRVAGMASVASVLAAAAVSGPLVGAAILILYAPMGMALGIGARQGWSAARVVAVAAVVSAASIVLSYLGLLGGESLSMAEMGRTMERSVEMSAGLYARLGLPQAQIDAVSKQMREFARLIPFLLPFFLVSASVSAAWLNYEVARRVLGRFKYHLNPLPPVRTWRVPAAGIWLVPVCYMALGFGMQPGAPAPLKSAGLSLWFVTMSVFTFQGLVTGWIVLGNFGFGRFAQVVTVALAITTPVLNIAVLFLGLLDSALKVRERWGVPRPAAPGAPS